MDKVGADVALLHSCSQSCTPNPVEGRLKVYKDVVAVLLVLEIFLTAWVTDLLCGAPTCSEACLFFRDDLFRLWLQSVQYDLQHDFAWVTEAYCSVVLALLQVAFLQHSSDGNSQ